MSEPLTFEQIWVRTNDTINQFFHRGERLPRYLSVTVEEWNTVFRWFRERPPINWEDEETGAVLEVKMYPMHDSGLAAEGYPNILLASMPLVMGKGPNG